MAQSKLLLRRGFKTEAEKTAEHYRAELNISKFGALNAFALAEHLGVLVAGISDILPEEEVKKLHNPAKQESFSALLTKNIDNDSVIIHNNLHSEYRQQSNLMHELAHYICGHEIPKEILELNLPLNLRYFNPVHEEEAKYLGGCLQITRAGLMWKTKSNFSETDISDYYGASIEMVKYRLNTTGVLKFRRR